MRHVADKYWTGMRIYVTTCIIKMSDSESQGQEEAVGTRLSGLCNYW